MRKFGLIGYPLGHSFSRKYFTEKFSREKIIDCSYENFPLKDIKELPDLINAEPLLAGLNVTIPHKSGVMPFLDTIEQEAAEIGAVNVIKVKREGRRVSLQGFNSDITGLLKTLLPLLNPEINNAIIFGTGGASKAVCHALEKLSVKYTLISRNRKQNCLTYSDIDKKLIDSARLLINTTPLGMYPDLTGKPEFDYNLLSKNHLLFDLIYNPEITAFMREGQERGCKVVNGLNMLISQAERSWEIWNDDTL